MPRGIKGSGKAAVATVSAAEVLSFFRNASAEVTDLVLDIVNGERRVKAAASERQREALVKARAAKGKGKGANSQAAQAGAEIPSTVESEGIVA